MKMRSFLRGSGRFLAFIFIASVVWLMFDMAVLRLSVMDVNSRLLNELQNRTKELKRSAAGIRNHPVDQDWDTRLNVQDQTAVDVYRRRKSGWNRNPAGDHSSVNQIIQKKQLNQSMEPGTMVPSAGKDTNNVVPGHHTVATTDDLEVHPASLLTTKRPQNAAFLQKSVLTTPPIPPQQPNLIKTLQQSNKTNFSQVTPGPGDLLNTTFRRSGSFHKVINLDVTLRPRDAQAPGQFGQAAQVPPEMLEESKRRWPEGHFNVFLSEQIPVDRAVPDTRPSACLEKLIPDGLPSTSVIFCFVDEVWSTLLRSVHSVLNRSPPHLLKEILLVDDCSTKDFLKDQLDDYMAQFPKVRIIRLKTRQGLIRARLAGAAEAKGDVLTFLDSHIECNVGWLEPLLERLTTRI